MADDRVTALERRRAELLERRRELRAAGAAPTEIIPVVEELDRVEAELRALSPEAPAEDDSLRWRDAVLVGAAGVVVAAVATGAAALGFRSSSAATTTETVVRARLHSSLHASPCSTTSARARLTFTWTLASSGHEGEVALISASGPGIAPRYHIRVRAGHVRLVRTTPCEPAGTTVWKVRLVRVGSTPAEVSH